MSGRDGADKTAGDGAQAGAVRVRVLEAAARLQSAVIAGGIDLDAGFAEALQVVLEVSGAEPRILTLTPPPPQARTLA
jgi:hypothetical protein